jgi:hypothetical protein
MAFNECSNGQRWQVDGRLMDTVMDYGKGLITGGTI